MKPISLLSALLLILPGSSAMAEGMDRPETLWGGASAGIGISAPLGDNYWTIETDPQPSAADNWSGTQTDLHLGYDWQADAIVYGLRLGAKIGTISAKSGSVGIWICDQRGGCATELSNMVDLTARLGWASGNTLFYSAAGVVRADVKGAWGSEIYGAGSRTGWSLGAGIERKLRGNLTVSGELSYINLGTMKLEHVSRDYSTKVKVIDVNIGLNYRW